MNNNKPHEFVIGIATLVAALVTILLGAFAFLGRSPDLFEEEQPAPVVQPARPIVPPVPAIEPQPAPLCPGPGPCPPQPQPNRPRKPWIRDPFGPREGAPYSGPFVNPGAPRPAMAQVGSGTKSPDGTETIQLDLPPSLRMHNAVGTNHAGLCVTTSLNHAANLQSIPCLYDLQTKMKHERGGAGPADVDRYLVKYCPDIRGKYWQNEQSNIAYLKAVIASGRMPSVFYNCTLDPHYGKFESHMVNLVHASDNWFCVMDNNYPADKDLVWMRPATFDYMHTSGGRSGGWAVAFKEPGAMPIAHNARSVETE